MLSESASLQTFPHLINTCVFQLGQWPRSIAAKFQYQIYPITFSVGNQEEWKKLFKPCAAQRLFLPVRQGTTVHPAIQWVLITERPSWLLTLAGSGGTECGSPHRLITASIQHHDGFNSQLIEFML